MGSKWPKISQEGSKWVKTALSSTGQIKVTRFFPVFGRIGRFSGTRSTEGGMERAPQGRGMDRAPQMGGVERAPQGGMERAPWGGGGHGARIWLHWPN